jgi:hypothetical protein
MKMHFLSLFCTAIKLIYFFFEFRFLMRAKKLTSFAWQNKYLTTFVETFKRVKLFELVMVFILGMLLNSFHKFALLLSLTLVKTP